MALAITFRNCLSTNLFRDTVIATIDSGAGNSAILCSGFFQENFKSSAYQASKEPNFLTALKKLDSLKTVGIHNNIWLPSYKKFRDNLKNSGVNITAYYKKGFKWHAKIFILLRDDSPVFGIIGSSNITANAFGASNSPNHSGKFNYECDVCLWPDSESIIIRSIKELIQNNQLNYQVIIANYDKTLNFGLSEEQRLIEFRNEILSDDLQVLQ